MKKIRIYFGIAFALVVGLTVYSAYSADPYIEHTSETNMQIVLFSIILAFGGFFIPRILDKYRLKQTSKNLPRRPFSEEQKTIARNRQNGICLRCNQYPSIWEYHHRDGNRSNNRTSNCEAICPTCHARLERGLE